MLQQKDHVMNKSNITRHIVRAAVICLLALTPPMAFVVLHAADKPTAAPAPSQLAKDLMRTWVLVGKPGVSAIRVSPHFLKSFYFWL